MSKKIPCTTSRKWRHCTKAGGGRRSKHDAGRRWRNRQRRTHLWPCYASRGIEEVWSGGPGTLEFRNLAVKGLVLSSPTSNPAPIIMEGQPSEAGTSLHGEIHSSGFPWPPITPYDVLSLVTIIVFGIAKAVTTSVGATIAPTTLEWVGGVIVFLLQVLLSQPNFMPLTYAGFMW